MHQRCSYLWWVCWLSGLLACNSSVFAIELPAEYVTTSPLVVDGVLYAASAEPLYHRGHLRAIDILATFPVPLWDAAEKMPRAGSAQAQPATIHIDNQNRYIVSNLAEGLHPFAADQGELLASALGLATVAEAEMLLHAVRGRRGGSLEQVAGDGEDPLRFWGVSRSAPVIVDRSSADFAARQRDRMIYVGAEDGMLHALLVSRWDDLLDNYPINDPAGGTELWAYLPGSFLPYLKDQPLQDYFGELAVHLDGTPLVKELFLDRDGDGRFRWHTLLVTTGAVLSSGRSCLFVLDVTDPYQPELLWEMLLPGSGSGRAQGVNLDRCGSSESACLYLTTDFVPEASSSGVHALAIALETGQLLWQFSAPYDLSGQEAQAVPAIPALMDIDGNDKSDTLVFGDLAGRLWALDLIDGRAYGDGPVYKVPGARAEPIGAGVAVFGRQVVFGTGGAEGASAQAQYALYAVNISPDGGDLRWVYPLEPGERVWATPSIDAYGNVIFATAYNYLPMLHGEEESSAGRIIALEKSGEEATSHMTTAATVGRVVTGSGLVVSVSLTGEATQFGHARRLTGPQAPPGSVKIYSWRPR